MSLGIEECCSGDAEVGVWVGKCSSVDAGLQSLPGYLFVWGLGFLGASTATLQKAQDLITGTLKDRHLEPLTCPDFPGCT